MDNYLYGLNDKQLEAVTSTEGYIRVNAGAGSGKTKALASRYIYLVDELGVPTSNILCATFSRKAAEEMKNRIKRIIPDCEVTYVCTFHSFCVKVLKEDIHLLNYPNNFRVLDSGDTEVILDTVYEKYGISTSEHPYSEAYEIIARQKKDHKNVFQKPYIGFLLHKTSEELKHLCEKDDIESKLFYAYLYEQKKAGGLDFSDLLYYVLYLFETFPQIKEKWQNRMQYIMVDEFQDVNDNQESLVNVLCGIHNNLFVVGDPDQTIYSWRGADVNIFIDFDKKHKNTKDIVLDLNYRSQSGILDAANSLISKNTIRMPKELHAVRGGKEKVQYYKGENQKSEAKWIVDNIETLVKSGSKLDDILILYRSGYMSRAIEEALMRKKIPYSVQGVEFYSRREIKIALSYLSMIVNENDDFSFRYTINEPRREFGKTRMKLISEYAETKDCSLYTALKDNSENPLIKSSDAVKYIDLIEKYKKLYSEMTISDLFQMLIEESGYWKYLERTGEDERLENLLELKQSIWDYESSAKEKTSLEMYIDGISIYTSGEKDKKENRINMMSIHSAKGLEAPYVFVCGMDEGKFPSSRIKSKEGMEEERRLAYVAITRAEDKLFLSSADESLAKSLPSRFVMELDEDCVTFVNIQESDEIAKYRSSTKQNEGELQLSNNCINQNTYAKGTKVKHSIWGCGTVDSYDSKTHSYYVKFDALSTIRAISENKIQGA